MNGHRRPTGLGRKRMILIGCKTSDHNNESALNLIVFSDDGCTIL
jgi:hypothetical protein